MPTRHKPKFTDNREQGSSSSVSSQGTLRARPALPGRTPQVDEAELFLGVTETPAEPDTGAIPSGPNNIGLDVGTFRLGSILRISGGFSYQASDSLKYNHASICSNKIPLRNNHNDLLHSNDLVESVSDRGHGQEDLDRSGTDSASAICGSSEGDSGARQGVKEPTIFMTHQKQIIL